MKKVVSLLLTMAMLISCVSIACAVNYTQYNGTGANPEPIDQSGSKIYQYKIADTTSTSIPMKTITQFNLYYAENGRLVRELENNNSEYHLEPGGYIYMVLGKSNELKDEYKVSSVRIQTTEKEYQKVIANGKCEVVKMRPKGVNSADAVFVCAKIPITYIPTETYKSSDIFVYYGELLVKLKGFEIYPKVYAVFSGYDIAEAKNNSDTYYLEETPHVYKFDLKNDDRRDIHVEDETGCFMFDAETLGYSETIASINHEELVEIVDTYGEYTDLTFYNATGNFRRLYNIVLSIFADGEGRYLYKYQDGILTDLSSYYNAGSDCFEIPMKGSSLPLTTYIVSGDRLTALTQQNPDPVVNPTIPAGSIIVIPKSSTPASVYPSIPNTGVPQE